MTRTPDYPQTKTTALIAYILDMGTAQSVPRAVLDALVDAICEDAEERSRLISVVSLSQSPEIRPQVLELLGLRLARLNDALEVETDRDDIIGVWSQRLAGGAILAGVGAAFGGFVTGAWALPAVVLPFVAGAVVTKGRAALRKRARAARRACESTQGLIDLLKAG